MDYTEICRFLFTNGVRSTGGLFSTTRELIKEKDDGILGAMVSHGTPVCSLFPNLYDEYEKYLEEHYRKRTVNATIVSNGQKCKITDYFIIQNVKAEMSNMEALLTDKKAKELIFSNNLESITFRYGQ